MKCKFCYACKKGYFESKPDSYVCTGVKEPFIINDIEQECTEYKNTKTTYDKIKEINNHNLEELYLTVENGCASDIELNDMNKLIDFIYNCINSCSNLMIKYCELEHENKILKNIIIEKEKELYNK